MIEDNCTATNPTELCDVTSFGHSLHNGFSTAISIYFILLIIGSVTLNLLLIYVIVHNRVLHSSTNILFVNLAFSDVITAVGVLPWDVDFLLQGSFRLSKYICGVKETVFLLSLPASIINLLLLTFDRFLVITCPRYHRYLFTIRKIIIMVVLSWFYIFLVSLYPLMYESDAVRVTNGICYISFPHHYLMYELIANFSIPLAAILIMNVVILWHSKRLSSIEQIDLSNTDNGSESDSRVVVLTVPSNFMSAKIIMFIVGECLFCWLTFIMLAAINYSCNLCHPREVTWFGNAVNFSAVILNPILYGLLNSQIRTVVTEKTRQWRAKSVKEEDDVLALNDESTGFFF